MRVVAGLIMAASLLGAADRDMQRAIAWEHHKDQAAARQARLERRHPSVTYDANRADRSSDQNMQGRPVKDPRARKPTASNRPGTEEICPKARLWPRGLIPCVPPRPSALLSHFDRLTFDPK